MLTPAATHALWLVDHDVTHDEGWVVRSSAAFERAEFGDHVRKWVRSGHVQPDTRHWATAAVGPNRLANDRTAAHHHGR